LDVPESSHSSGQVCRPLNLNVSSFSTASLADDFVLVTGAEKVFSKADLLDEARSGKTVYEHQVADSRGCC